MANVFGKYLFSAVIAAITVLPAQADNGRQTQSHSFSVPGDGGWDYVTYDQSTERMFIGRSSGVQVLDAHDGHLIGMIGSPGGAHGVAVLQAADRVFTSDEDPQQVGIFTLSSLKPVASIALPGEPDGMVADPATGRVLALIPDRHMVAAIDSATEKIAATLDVGGGPEAGVSDGNGHAFLTLPETGELVRIDTRSMTVEARWKMSCAEPRPLAIDPVTRRLFVSCWDHHLLIVDGNSGTTVDTVTIGDLTDAVTFDPHSATVAVASGAGEIDLIRQSEVDANRYAKVGTIKTPKGARTMAADPITGRLFTVTADITSVEPPTADRPYPLLHSKSGTFRMITFDPEQQ